MSPQAHKDRADEDPDVRGLSEALAREFGERPEDIEEAAEDFDIQDPSDAPVERVDD